MPGRSDHDHTSGPSPWSSEANAPDAPPLSWETEPPSRALGERSGGGTSAGPIGPSPEPPTRSAPEADGVDERGADDDADPVRRPGRAAAAVAVVVALSAAVWLRPGADGDDGASPIEEPPATTLDTTTIGTATPTTDEEPVVDDAGEGEGDEPTSTAGDDESASGTASAGATASEGADAGSTTRAIDLPDGLPDFDQPFELVMATDEGLATLSLPSAVLRTVPITVGTRFDETTGLIAAPDRALVLRGASAVIVDREDGDVVDAGLDVPGGYNPVGWAETGDGSEFTLLTWSDTGLPELVAVDGAGGRRRAEFVPTFPTYTLPDGSHVLADGGGVFLVRPDGTAEQVATGTLLGAGSGRLLLRHCDQTYDCRLATLDLETGRRIEFADVEDTDLPSRLRWGDGATVAPDGRSFVVRLPDAATASTVEVVLAADGSGFRTRHPSGIFWGWSPPAWAPDASGYFRAASDPSGTEPDAVEFVRSDGEVVVLDRLPERVSAVAVRPVDEELPIRTTPAGGLAAQPSVGVAFVGVDRGTASYVDVGAGTIRSWLSPDLGPRPDLFFVDGNVIGVSADGTRSFRSTDGRLLGERSDQSPGSSSLLPGTDDRLVWQGDGEGAEFVLVPIAFHDIAGRSPWKTVEVGPEAVYGTDGAGRLVYRVGGEVFVTDGLGTTRLTSGALVAIGPSSAVVFECDESGDCANVRVSADGTRTAVDGPPAAALPLPVGPNPAGTVSPDGAVVFVRVPADRIGATTDADPDTETGQRALEWVFVDDAGAIVVAPPPDEGADILWSEDSRVALYLSGGLVHLLDREAGEIRPLTGAGRFDAIQLVSPEFVEG